MEPHCAIVVTGQQIGVGWTPALSVAKALTALATARQLGGRAVYWMADEDHDRLEVSLTVGFDGDRLVRHRFHFEAPQGTATGWLPWTETQQALAESLWGDIPPATEPSLRGHVLALGRPLWRLGLEAFSPTHPGLREPIQSELARWRSLGLEAHLMKQAEHLEAEGQELVLDPRKQAAWFSLDPRNGLRRALAEGEACPPGCWLSPGAALRPLMQSLLLKATHVVLGPSERLYWQLTEPLWDLVDLAPPEIIARPSVYVLPRGLDIAPSQLQALRHGYWEAFPFELPGILPTGALAGLRPDPAWGPELIQRFNQTLAQTRRKLIKLDRRFHRDLAGQILGMDPERLRQFLFPLSLPQERVLPGILWLQDEALLARILEGLAQPAEVVLVEAS